MKAVVIPFTVVVSVTSAHAQGLPAGFVFLRDIDPTTLMAAMSRQGFVNYSKEWWHFSLPGAGGQAYDFLISARRN